MRPCRWGICAEVAVDERMNVTSKNTICLWYDGAAEEAARFYARTFPDSEVLAVHTAPGDYPSGKQGDVLTVEFTVLGIPCLGLNGGPAFKHSEAFSFQVATDDQAETDRLWNAIVDTRRAGQRVRMVQGQVGPVVADHPMRADRGDHRSRSCGGPACLRSDDADDEDRHRCDRGGPARLKFTGRRGRPKNPQLKPGNQPSTAGRCGSKGIASDCLQPTRARRSSAASHDGGQGRRAEI